MPNNVLLKIHFMNIKTLGMRIKEVIDEKGLTLEAFGKPLGVSKESVSYWINDRTKDLKMDNLFGFEDKYDVSARWIALGEGPKTTYSSTTRMIADMLETLDEEGKESIKKIVLKEKHMMAIQEELSKYKTQK